MIHLHGVHGRCIISGDGGPWEEGAASHACLQCSICGNDAVVTAAQGDRRLLQGTVDERRIVNSPCGAIQVDKLIREPAGSPRRP